MYDNNNYPNDYTNHTGSGANDPQIGSESVQGGNAYSPYQNTQSTGQSYTSRGTEQSAYGAQSSYGSRNAEQNSYGSLSGYDSRGAEQRSYSSYNSRSAAQGSSAGTYHYGNVYPNSYAQTVQKPEKKKKAKTGGGYFKKALAAVSLGLFFGVFAGLGLYAVDYATGILGGKDEKAAEAEAPTESKDSAAAALLDEETTKQPVIEGDLIKQSDAATTVVTDVTEVVKKVMPSIVAVNNHYTETMSWFGQSMDSEADASGSGIIVGLNDAELLIVSNYHVVADTDKLTVQFNEGSEAEAFI
ncbi:MAG: S1C family serine protease, partial [bacterium]|nr:S1C family serine protease [bacterium]